MTHKKKVLVIVQEMEPYLGEGGMAAFANALSRYAGDNGCELRILMPRFSGINERRHRLHEVVRLSGMNLIIDEDDYPLLIKVASLPGSRLQVYFLDNGEFFKRKNTFRNDEGKFYSDNAERMVFYCKGALETVKKFGWSPDIIHCHGWMTSLVPLYVKIAYKIDPVFNNARIVYSVYPNEFEEKLQNNFFQKASIKRIEDEELRPFAELNNNAMHRGAIHYADAVMICSPDIDPEIAQLLAETNNKPVIQYAEEQELMEKCRELYNQLTQQETTEEDEQ